MEKYDVVMLLLALSFFSLVAFSRAISPTKIGISYGRLGDDLPSPSRTIELLKSMKAGAVKLYDANPEILDLLAETNIQVSITVTNEEITSIASDQANADQWVRDHVLAYYPSTMIRFILVGNEVLSYNETNPDIQTWYDLVPAMRRITTTLRSINLPDIIVGTPLAMDMMERTFPPSSGRFRKEVRPIIIPLLEYLSETQSIFFVDVYPYFSWSANPTNISLDFALLRGENGSSYKDPVSGLVYTNLLDQMLDSVIFAMGRLGFNDIMIGIAETGWPNGGDSDETGANVQNAATYNRNLVRKMTAVPPMGTPAIPWTDIPTFIFSLYNENQKAGPGIERHWGLLYHDGTPVYDIDLTGNYRAIYK